MSCLRTVLLAALATLVRRPGPCFGSVLQVVPCTLGPAVLLGRGVQRHLHNVYACMQRMHSSPLSAGHGCRAS